MSSSLQVVDSIPGLTYRQLDYWITAGLIAPSTRAIGSGYPREIPDAEVAVIRLMADLVAEGLTPTRAAQVARSLIADGSAAFAGLVVTRGAA